MHNLVYLIGRLVDNPKLDELEGKQITKVQLAVQRSYKNIDGEYETDFFDCILWNGIASNTCEYCHKGDLIGIKGRLQNIKNKHGNKYSNEIVVEKLSFLSSINKADEFIDKDE